MVRHVPAVATRPLLRDGLGRLTTLFAYTSALGAALVVNRPEAKETRLDTRSRRYKTPKCEKLV